MGVPETIPDWDRFRNLFHKDARMSTVVPGPEGKGFALRSFTPQDYVKRSGKMLERGGFFEVELARKTESFGHIAHCFSSYELKQGGKDGKLIARGVNSMQLLNDGKRWWFLSIYWESERTAGKLPKRYLSGK